MNRLLSRRSPLQARGVAATQALCVMAALVTGAASLTFAPSALAAEPGQIAGTVTNASSGEPIDDVEVCAYQIYRGPGADWGCVKTESNGEYAISGLRAGEYRVEFSARYSNYLPQVYNGRAPGPEADSVSVAAGQTTSGIDAALQEGARITGRVTSSATQEALAGITVCAVSVHGEAVSCGKTIGLNAEYEIAQIPTGEYRIKFDPPSESGLNYVPQFYDDKLLSSEARVLSIVAGSLTSGINAELQEGGHIRGQVTDASSKAGIGSIRVCANEPGGEGGPCTETGMYGEYTLSGLASGQYKLVFYPNGRGYLPGETTASVTAPDTTNEVNVELVAGGQVTGRVTSASTQAAIPNVEVCAREVGGKPGEQEPCATSGSNGEYTILPLPSDEYTITFSASTFEDLDYFFYEGPTVKVTAGETISGVDAALTEGGRITGRVTDAATGEPLEGIEACAGYQCGSTNANGEYIILRLNGEYRVQFSARSGDYLGEFYGDKASFAEPEASPVSVTAPDTTSGIDVALQPGRFTEPANTAPPTISGTAAVGDTLTCSPGSWTGDPAPTFTYAWLRDGTWITGAHESSYAAQATDEGHSVTCEVDATSTAGDTFATARAVSAGVIVEAGTVNEISSGGSPGPGAPALPTETTTGLSDTAPLAVTPFVTVTDSKVVVSGATAPVSVECNAAMCQGSIELTVQVAGKHHAGKDALARKETLVLATGSFSLTQGKSRTVVLRLTAAGKRLLAHAGKRHPVAAKLRLSVNSGKAMTRAVLAV
jgi:molybdopterin-binding protein